MIVFRPKDQISVAAGAERRAAHPSWRRDAQPGRATSGGISLRQAGRRSTPPRSNGARATGASASSTFRPTIGTNSFRCRREPIRSKSSHPPGPERLDRLHDAAQLRQALEPAGARLELDPNADRRVDVLGRQIAIGQAAVDVRQRHARIEVDSLERPVVDQERQRVIGAGAGGAADVDAGSGADGGGGKEIVLLDIVERAHHIEPIVDRVFSADPENVLDPVARYRRWW